MAHQNERKFMNQLTMKMFFLAAAILSMVGCSGFFDAKQRNNPRDLYNHVRGLERYDLTGIPDARDVAAELRRLRCEDHFNATDNGNARQYSYRTVRHTAGSTGLFI